MSDEDGDNFAPEIKAEAPTAQPHESGYFFDRFSFYPARQLLLENGSKIKLGGRATIILALLVERAGELVSNEELLHAVWPSRPAEEGNLRVHVAAIRKALHDRASKPTYLSNVVGRGYQFVAGVKRVASTLHADRNFDALGAPTVPGLPLLLTRVLGRKEAVDDILRLLEKQRLVSIVGSGGIGKTTIALVAARRLSKTFADGIFFVDLATVSKPDHVSLAIATILGFSVETEDAVQSMVSYLRNRQALLIFDNCEHVIDAAATIAEALLKGAPDVKVLTTTHEPLMAEGERLFRLKALELPGDQSALTLKEAVSYPSIELFVERAKSANQQLMIDDDDVISIVKICRRLDGIPLAIEIAAAQVYALGINSLAEGLGNRLDVLSGGRRTAARRHQTIRNMHDWSYDNLSYHERVVLRRLSIFADAFSLDAAEMLFREETLASPDIAETIASLVRKSLLYSIRGERSVNFRLLESTKIHALEKLAEADELVRLRNLHLQLVIDMLERADAEWKDVHRVTWLARYSSLLAEVRSALGWAFSQREARGAGVKLTSLAMPLGIQLGLVDEFRERAEFALSYARGLNPPELIAEMRINLIHGILSQNQIRPNDNDIVGLSRAEHLADEIGAGQHELELQIFLSAYITGTGDYTQGRAHAERAEEWSRKSLDNLAVLASNRILAQASHFNGDHALAVTLAKSVIAHPIVNLPTAFGSVQIDRRVSMRVVIARALWMQGKVDEALPIIGDATEAARDDGPLGMCQALALGACPILLWRGDFDAAGAAAQALLEHSSRFTLRHWHSWGRLFEKIIEKRIGWRPDSGENLPGEGGFQLQTLVTLNSQLIGLDDTGLVNHGWSGPEVLRARGERLVILKDYVGAEMLFNQSIGLARQQGALSWELRSVQSLARLWHRAGKRQQALKAIADVRNRFSEGFETVDLVQAQQLIIDLNV